MAPTSVRDPVGGDLKSVCEVLWAIEDELGLFDMQIGDTHFWRLARWEACRLLTLPSRRGAWPEGSSADPMLERFRHEARALRHRLQTPSWRRAGPVETILVPFPRKRLQGETAVDMLSEPVMNEPDLGRLLVLERTDAVRQTSRSDRVFVADRDRGRQEAITRAILAFPTLLGPFGAVHRALDDAFNRHMRLPFPVSVTGLALRTALFAENRKIFRRMLRATEAKRFMAAWHDQAMFAAARDIGMETVELQHAAFSKYNPHYHFPKGGSVPHFADTFLLFADYWRDCVTLPSNTRARVLGSRNMEELRGSVAIQSARRVTIPSQGPTHWPLFDSVLEAAWKAPDWEFIFRPHPREDLGAYKARLTLRDTPANFRLSPAQEDLYGLIRTAEVQIGLASTALFEGMALGCRTIVFDSPMSASMAEVVNRGDATIAADATEIVAALAAAPAPSDPARYYAPPIPILDALRT